MQTDLSPDIAIKRNKRHIGRDLDLKLPRDRQNNLALQVVYGGRARWLIFIQQRYNMKLRKSLLTALIGIILGATIVILFWFGFAKNIVWCGCVADFLAGLCGVATFLWFTEVFEEMFGDL